MASDMIRGITPQPNIDQLYHNISERFVGICHFVDGKGYTSIFGPIQNPPKPTAQQHAHMLKGKPLLLVRPHSGKLSQIFLMQMVSKQDPESGYIVGEVNPVPFWGIGHENKLPPLTQLYVFDQSNNTLIGSIPVSAELILERMTRDATFPNRKFEFDSDGESFIASYWPLSLETKYNVKNWTVVLSQSQSDIFLSASEFRYIFPQVVMISLFIIFLLSIIYLRKILSPLEALKEGTRRVVKRDFSTPVDVVSNDEFKELAASFNTMSTQLDKQFKALTARSDIDRAILSSLDKEKMIETVITNVRKFFSCDATGFTLMGDEDGKTINYYLNQDGSAIHAESLDSEPQDIEKLRNHPDCLQYRVDGNIPFYLTPVANKAVHSFLILPLFVKKKLSGIIHLGYRNGFSLDPEDMKQARRFADQSAIALSNSNLVETLHQQNWRTLEALSRSVDAKSPWTAGHSERVTDLALKIGSVLKLDPEQLNILHRGGLLHDVGKIGVPSAILDKPGKLTDEEFEIIKTHPSQGVQILEPIKSFSDIFPIVVQHHERYDGKGYPQGLSGDAISLGARILAVADSYDAIVSDRSFRKGASRSEALDIIKEVSGTQFDPEVVKAFLKIAESNIIGITTQQGVNDPVSVIPSR
jgi:putative nucleotidyltransferase with HDIG domain